MTLKRMSIKVSGEMHEWLAGEAEKRGLTMNAIVIFALENYYNQVTVMPNISMMKDLMEQVENAKKQQ